MLHFPKGHHRTRFSSPTRPATTLQREDQIRNEHLWIAAFGFTNARDFFIFVIWQKTTPIFSNTLPQTFSPRRLKGGGEKEMGLYYQAWNIYIWLCMYKNTFCILYVSKLWATALNLHLALKSVSILDLQGVDARVMPIFLGVSLCM